MAKKKTKKAKKARKQKRLTVAERIAKVREDAQQRVKKIREREKAKKAAARQRKLDKRVSREDRTKRKIDTDLRRVLRRVLKHHAGGSQKHVLAVFDDTLKRERKRNK